MGLLNRTDIANRLISIRENLNLSRRDFALRAGVDQSQYNKIERGLLPITENTLKKLSETYSLEPDYILYGKGINVPHENRQKEVISDHDKYVALLESTNRTLEKAIQLSLNAILENQLLIKARLNATAEDIQDLLVDNGRKLVDVKEKTNKRMAMQLEALMKTGTGVGIPDRG